MHRSLVTHLRKFLPAIIPTILLLLVCIITGCSSSGSTLQPQIPAQATDIQAAASGSHYLWGYWLFEVDAGHTAVEPLPLRATQLHLNARRFLEEEPCQTCLSIDNITPSGNGTLLVDVKLRHPFLGQQIYTGFDVRGICIFRGSKILPASGLAMSDRNLGDGQLMNPDAYTTLFNPVDFAPGTGALPMFEYQQGNYAGLTPDATLNGYKRYFSIEERHVFIAGGTDTRQYEVDMPDGPFVFGYAVDASWRMPTGSPPYEVPGDWPISANSLEAYNIVADAGSGLTPEGGQSIVEIQVYDWQGAATVESVTLEAPDLFSGFENAQFVSNEGDHALFTATITNELGATAGEYDILIAAKDIADDPNLGELKTYFLIPVDVEIVSQDKIIIVPDEDGTFILDDILSPLCYQMGEGTQPYWDEFSPALCQEADGDIRIVWVAPRLDYWHAADISVSSPDGGQSWSGGGNMFGSLGSGPGAVTRTDTIKVAPDTEGDSNFILNFAGSLVCMVDAGRCVEEGKSEYAFSAGSKEEDLETFVDSLGYTIAFSDLGPGITCKQSLMTNQLLENQGGGSWDTSGYGPFTVTESGRISHVRSCDETSAGDVVLAYSSDDKTQILLATSPADGEYSTWTPDLLVYEADGGIVRDPCIQVDPSGGIHMCFAFDMFDEQSQLLYTYSSGNLDEWTQPVVVVESIGILHDAHLLWDHEFGADIVAFVYETGGDVYATLTQDAGATFNTPIIVSTMDENVQDPDAVALQDILGCDFIMAWSYPADWGYDDHDIRWRKAHFELE